MESDKSVRVAVAVAGATQLRGTHTCRMDAAWTWDTSAGHVWWTPSLGQRGHRTTGANRVVVSIKRGGSAGKVTGRRSLEPHLPPVGRGQPHCMAQARR